MRDSIVLSRLSLPSEVWAGCLVRASADRVLWFSGIVNKSFALAKCRHAVADLKCLEDAFSIALRPNGHSERAAHRYGIQTKLRVVYGVHTIPSVKTVPNRGAIYLD